MAHTVLQFVLAEFDNNWTRGGAVRYTAIAKAQLIVVAEGAAGTKETYWFQVARRGVVLVSMAANLIYIPARCARKVPGDKTKCG